MSLRFTFMLVPHGTGKARQIHIRLSHMLLIVGAWTGLTFWASYLSAQHVDYWNTKVSQQILKLKVEYLVKQLDTSRGMIDEVRQIEAQLRDLLQVAGREAQGRRAEAPSPTAAGGPTSGDQRELTQLLDGHEKDISWRRITEKVEDLRAEAGAQIDTFGDLQAWLDDQIRLYWATPRGWPTTGHISSRFGRRTDPFSRQTEFHYGMDIANAVGTPIRATADGVVRIAGWHSGYGKIIVLEHPFGYSTRYAHNNRLLVRPGERVRREQVIALMGSTGKSSGSHCHYEVWRFNKRKNPLPFMQGRTDQPEVIVRLAEKTGRLPAQ